MRDVGQAGDLAQQLVARGYERDGAWERVVLQGVAPDRWAAHARGCELLTQATAREWSQFVLDCYRMPPLIGDWLVALVGRNGWIHGIRRQNGRAGGGIVMARSLYHDHDGWAWLGIDAPVPGVMAPCFADDQMIVATLLAEAARRGAHSFVSDIEVPSQTRDTESYRRWGALGFSPTYHRNLFVKVRAN